MGGQPWTNRPVALRSRGPRTGENPVLRLRAAGDGERVCVDARGARRARRGDTDRSVGRPTRLDVNAIDVVHSGVSGNNGGYHTNPQFLEDLPNESSS